VAVLLVLGFPLTLVLAWAYDIVPGGVKRTEAAPATEDQPRGPSRTVDFVIIGVLTLALGFVTFNYVLVDDNPTQTTVETSPVVPATTGPVGAATEEENTRLPNSVAVLPLENLSPDPDNAYFAAGMHEEILNHLAKLRNLNVISRTSVTRYEDSDLSIPEIAAELNVETVMEGSVRFANDQARITLQLIDPLTDAHLWSEAYDGDLSDVLAIQADIAMNVANALEAEFSLEEQQSLERRSTTSDAAYNLYLRALNAWQQRADPAPDLLRAIELDPNFAEAYAQGALYLAITGTPSDETERLVVENAEKALELDPSLGLAHLALGVLHQSRWRGAEALASLERAYELNPSDPLALTEYARFNRYVGNYEAAVEANLRAAELDPNTRNTQSQLGTSLHALGEFDRAAEAFQAALDLDPSFLGTYTQFAQLEAARGNNDAALRRLEIAEGLLAPDNATRIIQMAGTYARLGRPDDALRMYRLIEAIDREQAESDARWAVAYLAIGDEDEAYSRLTNAIENQVPSGLYPYNAVRVAFTNLKSNVWGLPALEEPRFVELRDRIFALD
jgi:TolB-like protein